LGLLVKLAQRSRPFMPKYVVELEVSVLILLVYRQADSLGRVFPKVTEIRDECEIIEKTDKKVMTVRIRQ